MSKRVRGIEEGQRVNLLIGDLPAMEARVEEIAEDHAIVGLFKTPDPPLQSIGPIQGIVEAAGTRGITRLVGTLRQHGHDADAARLDFDQSAEVIQRRQFVRIDTTTPVVITRANGTQVKCTTLNLSGAGLMLGNPANIDMDEVIKLDIDVGDDEPAVHARGRVVRSTGQGHKGVRFEMIEEGDRDRLIHFIFERQRTQVRVKS